MPKAGYCRVCNEYKWLSDETRCVIHPDAEVEDVSEVPYAKTLRRKSRHAFVRWGRYYFLVSIAGYKRLGSAEIRIFLTNPKGIPYSGIHFSRSTLWKREYRSFDEAVDNLEFIADTLPELLKLISPDFRYHLRLADATDSPAIQYLHLIRAVELAEQCDDPEIVQWVAGAKEKLQDVTKYLKGE